MKITFLGTGAKYPEKNRMCSATLIESQGKKYIVDAGAPLLELLTRMEIPLASVREIYITRQTPDCLYGLLNYMEVSRYKRKTERTRIYLPSNCGIEEIKNYAKDGKRFLHGISVKSLQKVGKIRLFAPTFQPIYDENGSYSYVFEDENKRILFVGGRLCPQKLLSRHYDLAVVRGDVDLSDKEVVETVRKISADRLAVNHLDTALNNEEKVQRFFACLAEKQCLPTADGYSLSL